MAATSLALAAHAPAPQRRRRDAHMPERPHAPALSPRRACPDRRRVSCSWHGRWRWLAPQNPSPRPYKGGVARAPAPFPMAPPPPFSPLLPSSAAAVLASPSAPRRRAPSHAAPEPWPHHHPTSSPRCHFPGLSSRSLAPLRTSPTTKTPSSSNVGRDPDEAPLDVAHGPRRGHAEPRPRAPLSKEPSMLAMETATPTPMLVCATTTTPCSCPVAPASTSSPERVLVNNASTEPTTTPPSPPREHQDAVPARTSRWSPHQHRPW